MTIVFSLPSFVKLYSYHFPYEEYNSGYPFQGDFVEELEKIQLGNFRTQLGFNLGARSNFHYKRLMKKKCDRIILRCP